MNTDTQHTDDTGRIEPRMNRRQMIKTIGAAGGAAAVGTGAAPHPGISSVGQSEAFIWDAIEASGAGLGPGVVAGIYNGVFKSDIDEDDISDDREDRVHETAEALSIGKETWEDLATHEYQNTSDPDQTPFGEAAWTEVRTRTVIGHANEKDRTEVKSDCRDAVALQYIRSVVNIMEAHNSIMEAYAPELAGEMANGWEQVTQIDGSNWFVPYTSSNDLGDFSKWTIDVDGSETPIGVKLEVEEGQSFDWPRGFGPSDLEGREEGLNLYFPGSSVSDTLIVPIADLSSSRPPAMPTDATTFPNSDTGIFVTHSNRATTRLWSETLFREVMSKIDTAYDNVQADVGTFVDEYYDQAEFGDFEPARSLTPSQLYSEFSTGSDQERIIAELAATGLDVPEDAGIQAKISHPDLPVDEAWGWLFPRLNDPSRSLTAGDTLTSSEYSLAWFVRVTDDTTETKPYTLSGDSDLKIIDVDTPESEDVETGDDLTAGSNGSVVVWSTVEKGEAPDPIKYPSDHSAWSITVVGSSNRSNHSPTELEENSVEEGTEYVLPTTSLNEGELVESIRIVSPLGFEQPIDYVSDPTSINPSDIQERYERMTDFYDQVRDAFGFNGGGGGIFDGFDGLFGLGAIETIIVAVLGLAGLNAATG